MASKIQEQFIINHDSLLNQTQIIAKIGGWEWDVEKKESFWTEETCHIHDVFPDEFQKAGFEIIGISLECYSEKDRALIEDAFNRCLKNGEEYELECRFTSFKGRKRWVRTGGKAVWQNNKIKKIFGYIQDITEKKSYELELKYLITHDKLTGLANREMLYGKILESITKAQNSNTMVAVLLHDINRFKVINDSLGHAFGDKILCALAKRFENLVKENDTVARMGGDEFVVLLTGVANEDEVSHAAREFLKRVAEPLQLDGREITVATSMGISLYPRDSQDPETLIRFSDIAMYKAKNEGGNSFCFYSPEMNKRAIETLELESALRKSLETGEFFLLYQPKVDLMSGRVIGCEALVRWHHPTMGIVSPGNFLPVAEETGLIVPLGAWVLKEACRQNMIWQAAGLPKIAVSVNLSIKNLHKENLAIYIKEVLRDSRMDPRWLGLEITESLIMGNPAEAENILREIRKTGVLISLDDFGTGYSSLTFLHRFPVDFLKIDTSFITKVTRDPYAANIVSSIIAMAHSMRIKVVAEGVENEGQLGFLRKHCCDEIQGYYFSPPLSGEDFGNFLRQGKCLPGSNSKEIENSHCLLIVDDEPNILSALRRVLGDEGYRVLTAPNAEEGFEMLAKNHIQVIISDQRMPQMNGTEFLRRVRLIYPDTVRIVLSGYADLETVVSSVNEGALYKFLGKPWDDDHLREQIRDAFTYYEAVLRPRPSLSDQCSFCPVHKAPV